MAHHPPLHVSADDHLLVTDAVAEAESRTSGEIVTVLARQSDGYEDVALVWASIISFVGMSLFAVFPECAHGLYDNFVGGWGHGLTSNQWLGLVIAVGVLIWLAAWFALLWQPLRLFLTPRSILAARVRAKAVNLFRVGAEAKTMGRTGVLLFVSLNEHRADIVADTAIAAKVDPAVWGDAMAALIAHVRKGEAGKGMAEAVRQMGGVLAQHFPQDDHNPNELPDRLIEL
jgi:putative membrane protein